MLEVQEEREPKIEVVGGAIKYARALRHLCERKVEVRKKTSGSVVDLFEVWFGRGARCMCFSEVEATLTDLAPGPYAVNVYETGTKPEGGDMEEKLIITKNVSVE